MRVGTHCRPSIVLPLLQDNVKQLALNPNPTVLQRTMLSLSLASCQKVDNTQMHLQSQQENYLRGTVLLFMVAVEYRLRRKMAWSTLRNISEEEWSPFVDSCV